jgi:hypothetical protein
MAENKTKGGEGETPATTTASPAAPKATLLGNVSRKGEFLCKRGPCFAYQGKNVDLRKITDETAVALANDPRCMFVIWKDAAKRPQGQRIQSLDVYVNV